MTMMKCGHSANSSKMVDGVRKPACVICAGLDPGADIVAETPDFGDRLARCSCGKKEPSSDRLAFFEYLGNDTKHCNICGMTDFTHPEIAEINPFTKRKNEKDHKFEVRVYEFDRYYCGCRGWD